jgi:hypothetical protein
MYALIENGEITRVNIDFPAVVNGVSFSKGSTEEDARKNGLVPIVGDEPSHTDRERLAGPQYVFDGTNVNRVFTVEPIPDAEKAGQVRAERNQMLKDCDWTQVVDAPLTQSLAFEWQTYRQALRDITSQTGFPWDVTWPDAP